MNISKDSWHYQVFEFAMKRAKYSETVCSYLRGVVFGLLKVLAIALAFATVLFSMLVLAIALLTGTLLTVAMFPKVIVALLILLSLLSWGGTIAFAVFASYSYLMSKDNVSSVVTGTVAGISKAYKAIPVPKIKEGSFTDILWTRIKNQHDKICTIVVFTKD